MTSSFSLNFHFLDLSLKLTHLWCRTGKLIEVCEPLTYSLIKVWHPLEHTLAMLLSVSAAVESIAVNSDLKNIINKKLHKQRWINKMWHKGERSKIEMEVWGPNSKCTYDFLSPSRWVPLKLPRTAESRGKTQTSPFRKVWQLIP